MLVQRSTSGPWRRKGHKSLETTTVAVVKQVSSNGSTSVSKIVARHRNLESVLIAIKRQEDHTKCFLKWLADEIQKFRRNLFRILNVARTSFANSALFQFLYLGILIAELPNLHLLVQQH